MGKPTDIMKLLKNNHAISPSLLALMTMVEGLNIDSGEGVKQPADRNGTLRRASMPEHSGRKLHNSEKDKQQPPPPSTQAPTLTSESATLWNVVTDANGNEITTCKVLPEGNSTTAILPKAFGFDYYLYLSEADNADVSSQIAIVETKLHEALTPLLLPCSFVEGDTIVAALSSEGADQLVGECQDSTISPCWQVRAQITLVMSSTLSYPEWMALLSPYMETSLAAAVDGQNITNIEFRGFVDSDLTRGQASPGTDVANPSGSNFTASAMQGNMALTAPPSQGLGPAVIAMAALVLVLLSVFLIQRHRRRQALFLAQLESETCDDVSPTPTQPREHKVAFMNDHEFLGQGEADGLEVIDEESRHTT